MRAKVPAPRGWDRPWLKGMPSLAAMTSGWATIHSLVVSDRPWVMTQPPCGAVAAEGLLGQPLAGLDPLQPFVVLRGPALPAVEEGRLDAAGAGGVGIGLRRHVDPARLRPPDQLEGGRGGLAGAAVHVDDVQGGAGGGGVGDGLLEGGDGLAAAERPGRAKVDEYGRPPVGGGREQAPDLLVAGPRGIGDAEPEAEGALVEPRLHQPGDAAQLLVGGRLVEVGAAAPEGERALVVPLGLHRAERLATGALMADRRPVVDERPPLAVRVPRVDGVDPDLQLHRRRHPVARLIPLTLGVLAVGVEVDEPRRDDEAGGVEHLARLGPIVADGDDDSVAQGHVGDRVEPGLGVHDPAPRHEQVHRSDTGAAAARDGEAPRRGQRDPPSDAPPGCASGHDAAPSACSVFTGHARHGPRMLRQKDPTGIGMARDAAPSACSLFTGHARHGPRMLREGPHRSGWRGMRLPPPVPCSPGMPATARGCSARRVPPGSGWRGDCGFLRPFIRHTSPQPEDLPPEKPDRDPDREVGHRGVEADPPPVLEGDVALDEDDR